MRLVFKSQNALSSPAVLCRVRVAPVLKAAVSPFKQSKQKRGDPDVGPLPLTPENVELVLDEMRPYLVADGGNVSLAEINGGIRCRTPRARPCNSREYMHDLATNVDEYMHYLAKPQASFLPSNRHPTHLTRSQPDPTCNYRFSLTTCFLFPSASPPLPWRAGTVRLELLGACGSCASSTMTMKMGLERGLREKIPEILEVEQVN